MARQRGVSFHSVAGGDVGVMATDRRPFQGVVRFSPKVSWDRVQPPHPPTPMPVLRISGDENEGKDEWKFYGMLS